MVWACSMHWGQEKCVQCIGGGEHEGNAYLEYQDIDGRIIWNGFIWLRTGTSDRLL